MNATDPTTVSLPQASDLLSGLRRHVREAIELVLNEELEAALGAAFHQRSGERRGYRHGTLERHLVTESGPVTLTIPRGRVHAEDGGTTEWRSELLPRYQRRTAQVDAALLGVYLAGTNQRRIRKALSPLLGEAHLSKSAISRIVSKLRAHFDAWRTRDLCETDCVYVYLDGIRLAIRMAGRVVSVPVLAALGVCSDGSKILLSLQIAGSESTASWKALVRDLSRRHLPTPLLVILDGNAGLLAAVSACWPEARIQRCTRHKLENLLAHAPQHAHAELKRDYRGIVDAASEETARARYAAFVRKWTPLAPEVVRSLQEAGEHLLTYYRFPKSQWKNLRTTNQLERLNGEFRRRTKTQGSFRNEASALVLLWGMIAFGQIRLRKLDGWTAIANAVRTLKHAA